MGDSQLEKFSDYEGVRVPVYRRLAIFFFLLNDSPVSSPRPPPLLLFHEPSKSCPFFLPNVPIPAPVVRALSTPPPRHGIRATQNAKGCVHRACNHGTLIVSPAG